MHCHFHPPLHLDRHSGAPFHTQIAAQISSRIAFGLMRDGVRLPPIRHLAQELRVERKTVALAYNELGSRGLTYANSTRDGTRVHRPNSPEFREDRARAAAQCLYSLILRVEGHGFTVDQLHQFWKRLNEPEPSVPDPAPAELAPAELAPA